MHRSVNKDYVRTSAPARLLDSGDRRLHAHKLARANYKHTWLWCDCIASKVTYLPKLLKAQTTKTRKTNYGTLRNQPSVRATVPCLTKGLVKDWRTHLMINRSYPEKGVVAKWSIHPIGLISSTSCIWGCSEPPSVYAKLRLCTLPNGS